MICALAAFLANQDAGAAEASKPKVLTEIIKTVEANYLIPVNAQGDTVDEVIGRLDSHSRFISSATIAEYRNGRQYADVGLGLFAAPDGLLVVHVSRGSTAEEAGIHAGDTIVALDGRSVVGGLVEVGEQLRGDEHTSVELTVSRRGEVRTVALQRALPRPRVNVEARRLGSVGYLRIDSFGTETATLVASNVMALRKENTDLRGLILDLRGCPGGLVDQAIAVVDHFSDGGTILIQRGRDRSDTERYIARPGDLLSGLPMVVLINGRSAAGAEIVAGALQEQQRAVILGTPSFGNGLVQTAIPLAGGRDGALLLTTAAWYLPSGRALQKVGVNPNILVVNSSEDVAPEFREVDVPGALDAPVFDATHPPQPRSVQAPEVPPIGYQSATGDYQLDRALAVILR